MTKAGKELLVKEQIVKEQPGMEQPGMNGPSNALPGAAKPAKDQPGKKVGAGFSGAVVGTVMTFLASRIDEPETKKFVLLSIPAVSVGAAGVSYKIIRVCHGIYLDRQIAEKRRRIRESALGTLADPAISQDSKEQARKDYEDSQVESRKDDLNSLRMLMEAKKHLSNEGAG